MTASDIAQRLASGPQTPERLAKAKALAKRSNIPWSDVQPLREVSDAQTARTAGPTPAGHTAAPVRGHIDRTWSAGRKFAIAAKARRLARVESRKVPAPEA